MLFFHAGALGDFVLTWPILLGAARTMAQCRIIAVTAADKGRLAEQVLRVEHRDAEAGWQALFAGGDVPDRPARALAGARRVVSLVADEGSRWAANVRRLAPAAEVTFLKPPPRDLAGGHAADFLVDQLAGDALLHAGAAGILDSLGRTGLMPKLHDPAGPVLVHPGSGSKSKNGPKSKNWPAGRFLDLVESLRDSGRRVRVVLGEAEAGVTDFDGVADVQRPGDLSELLFLLRGAGGYVGNDTGPTHLAAACGLPTAAIFRSTDPAAWRPLGPRVTVLNDPPVAEVAGALGA